MYQIRKYTFETNSSSVHNITICDADVYEKWVNGEDMYLFTYEGTIRTREEALKYIAEKTSHTYEELINNNDLFDNYIDYYNACTFEEYYSRDYEVDVTRFTSKNGDEIVAICEYGWS